MDGEMLTVLLDSPHLCRQARRQRQQLWLIKVGRRHPTWVVRQSRHISLIDLPRQQSNKGYAIVCRSVWQFPV